MPSPQRLIFVKYVGIYCTYLAPLSSFRTRSDWEDFKNCINLQKYQHYESYLSETTSDIEPMRKHTFTISLADFQGQW